LRSLLAPHPEFKVCGEASSGGEAVDLTIQLKPDLVILGIDLAELNGIDVAHSIKRIRPVTEILFYTSHDEEYLIAQALRAGARGYVLKSDSENRLLEAVQALARHLPFFTSQASQLLLRDLLKTDVKRQAGQALTARERDVVRLLADGKSNREIAFSLGISIKTVETHRSAIMRKLSLQSITDLVRYAIRNKIIQP
jgi:DNA-binding NarL/FixJ family response regulator